MVDIDPVAASSVAIPGLSKPEAASLMVNGAKADPAALEKIVERELRAEASKEELERSAKDVEAVATSNCQNKKVKMPKSKEELAARADEEHDKVRHRAEEAGREILFVSVISGVYP